MTFRVITGNNSVDKAKDAAARPAAPQDLAPVGQLLDRLEALSFTFEALNASSRTYAAEAVLETLARMERRDLQALAAIEAFASALKTVSQHLAGLRNAVQTTAHESAAGLENISARLSRLEQKAGLAAGADAGGALDGIAQRLASIEAKVAEPTTMEAFDAGPITEMLDTIGRRVSRIEQKVGDLPAELGGKFDPIPLTTLMETIARRLSQLEKKVEQAAPGAAIDLSPVHTALETIARRVSRIEKKLAEPPAPGTGLPVSMDTAPINAALETIARRVSSIEKKMDEPLPLELDASPLNDALDTIAERVGALEQKMDSGTDGHSIAACLVAVNRRLSRIEGGLGMNQPGNAQAAPAAAAPAPAPAPSPVADTTPAATAPEPLPAAASVAAAPATDPVAAASATDPVAAASATSAEAAGARQRVDQLLEQVFRVLSR